VRHLSLVGPPGADTPGARGLVTGLWPSTLRTYVLRVGLLPRLHPLFGAFGDIRLKEFSKPHLLRVGERAVRIRTVELA